VFEAEYLCEFTDTLDAVFGSEDVLEALDDHVTPLFGAQPVALDSDDTVVPLFGGVS
jgi:hypothetical protein